MAKFASSMRCVAVLSLLAVASCSQPYRSHGYVPPDAQLAEVEIGATRDDVETIVGRPSATGLVSDDGWFYVKSFYRDFAWRAPVEIDREVVAISFQGDTVANIERFGLEEGRVVPLSRRVTERTSQGIPFLQQLFGNLGNFNPGDFFTDE